MLSVSSVFSVRIAIPTTSSSVCTYTHPSVLSPPSVPVSACWFIRDTCTNYVALLIPRPQALYEWKALAKRMNYPFPDNRKSYLFQVPARYRRSTRRRYDCPQRTAFWTNKPNVSSLHPPRYVLALILIAYEVQHQDLRVLVHSINRKKRVKTPKTSSPDVDRLPP